MEFKAEFHQLGKIEEAEITVKPLTVIAGENGCGKSFATKSLYSLLGALNKDHVATLLAKVLRVVMLRTEQFKDTLRHPSAVDRDFLQSLEENIIPGLEKLHAQALMADFHLQKGLINNQAFSLEDVNKEIADYIGQRESVKKMEKPLKVLKEIQRTLETAKVTLESHTETVANGIAESLQDNLKKNFQVSDLRTVLSTGGKGSAHIRIDGIGNMSISREGYLEFKFEAEGINEIQRLDHIIFIDSPVYLKIRRGLERRPYGFFPRRSADRYLTGYPQYIDDLYQYLDSEYIDTPELDDVSQALQQLLAGKLVVGKSGEIDYQEENGLKTPLALTAMGVSNIGLIELLIRNNIIKKGSFLIIDEPEAHLHPKWQVALMDVLYKIAQAGANVIVATHSIDMVKKVELLLQKEDGAENLIALNSMPFDRNNAAKTELEKAEQILEQLSSPFYNMYMESL